jgi:hypothetical protein
MATSLALALIVGAYMVLSGILQFINWAQLRASIDRLEREAARRERAERAGRVADPARTAELERALGMDLDGLPPHVRTLIRLHRAIRRNDHA